jgi:hypothetical protein
MLLQWVGETWPSMPDGKPYHGKNLFEADSPWREPLQQSLGRPTADLEIEENLNTRVADIPLTDKGCPPSLNTNYISASLRAKGVYLKIPDKYDLITRLARGDGKMPDFDSFQIEVLAPEARFEAAVYNLLRSEPYIRPSRLLYSRVPVQH